MQQLLMTPQQRTSLPESSSCATALTASSITASKQTPAPECTPSTKMAEPEKAALVLSPDHIELACSFLCLDVRNSSKCPNNKLCRDLFSRSEGHAAILKLRKSVWTPGGPCESPSVGTVTSRKQKLIEVLESFLVVNDCDEKYLQFRINGKVVCKSFFKSAIAIPTKMFDSSVAYVLELETNAGVKSFYKPLSSRRQFCKSDQDAFVVGFLDNFFQSKGKRKLVDTSPNTTGYTKESFTIRMKWIQLYEEHYLPLVEKGDLPLVDYSRFCELRAKHRPLYVRHRKVSNKKWNHMECPDCVLLEEKFLRNPSERERYEKELNLHWEYQESFRDKYCQTIVKAVENSDFDLSMHIDGAAPDGMNYSPFYFKDITGEPAQHCCLRTHNTFVKIHGWGRIVFQSYPQLESQSSNMVIEIILRSIQLYLTKTNKKAVRNIYLQMDNASPNKSNVLIAALCCLPLLGICRKVKLSYLVRGHSHTDGDGDIGIAGSYIISTKNLQTFEDFADAVKSAFRSKSSGFTEVERIIGATDYIAMFPEYERNNYDMHGLTTAHSIRIVTDDEGVSPYVTYYDNLNHGSEAWFPRPAPAYPCGNWKEIFAHPSDPLRHGFPISGTCTPVALKGKRQHWQYYISYVSGDTQQFMLPCRNHPGGTYLHRTRPVEY